MHSRLPRGCKVQKRHAIARVATALRRSEIWTTDPVTLFLVFYPGAEYSQEIHYADPVFQQVAPRDQGEPQFGIGDTVEMVSGFCEAIIGFRNPRMGWTGATFTP